MSSNPDTLKQPAEGAPSDEPSVKKAKVVEGAGGESKVDNLDANKNAVTSNEGTNKNGSQKVPSKAVVNGNKDANEAETNDDDDGGEGASLGGMDPKTENILEQVEHIQLQIGNLNEKASEDILKVEQKYIKLRRPHFEKRNELLKEIPRFWLTTLMNHPILATMIQSEEDEGCLEYLTNLDVEENEDIKSGYKLKLHFSKNPFFTNETIVKEFRIVSNEESISQLVSGPIQYKDSDEGKALEAVVSDSVASVANSRRRGQVVNHPSFFAWLTEPSSEQGTCEISEILKDHVYSAPLDLYFAHPEEFPPSGDSDSDDDDEEELDEEVDAEELSDDDDDELDGIQEEIENYSEELDDEEDDGE